MVPKTCIETIGEPNDGHFILTAVRIKWHKKFFRGYTKGQNEAVVLSRALTPRVSVFAHVTPSGLARGNDLCREQGTSLHQGATQGSGSPLNRCYGTGFCQCVRT